MQGLTGVEAAKARVPSVNAAPPPPPPPPGSTVAVTNVNRTLPTPDGKTNTRQGWTSVHNETRNSTTKAVMAGTAYIQNQHLIGFGSATDPQPGAGAAYVWTFLDSTFGYPTSASGYFSGATERALTLCGAPPHMRSPKAGTTWDPMGVRSGAQLTSLSDYTPPHSSWFQEYADLCAAAAARYPHVKYFQVWNEMKGFYFVTQYAGSNLVPTGSGLPAAGGGNRWWSEGYTALFNKIYTAIKAVRPDAVIGGPYAVMNSFGWDSPSDQANGPFPLLLKGAWGWGDKKVLNNLMYFIKNCTGVDLLLMDIRNATKDGSSGGYYTPTVVPATPDPANKWLTNPEGGIHHFYWKEGQTLGAWNQGQKQADFVQWIRDLGASSALYQRPVADARTLPIGQAEWYAYGPNPESGLALDPRTGLHWAGEVLSKHPEECASFAWQYMYAIECGTYYALAWKPEGTIQGGNTDPGDSNPLALWYQAGQAGALTATELRAVMVGLFNNFPPGTQLKTVTSTVPEVKAMASATTLLVVNRSFSPVSFTLTDVNNPTATPITLAADEVRFIAR